MAKLRKKTSNNLLTYLIIAIVVGISVWALSRVVQTSTQTTKSKAYDNTADSLALNDSIFSTTDNACKASQLRFGRLVNVDCYDRVSFTCENGPKHGKRISLQAPVGSGGCYSEERWKDEAAKACGCGQEDRIFGSCKYKKVDFISGDIDQSKVSCTKTGAGTCFYEALVTCDNGAQHEVHSASCTRFKGDSSDWEFYANVVCCKKFASGTPGDDRPKACRTFGLSDYSWCNAYCKERGFECVADNDRFRCNDDRPESACK